MGLTHSPVVYQCIKVNFSLFLIRALPVPSASCSGDISRQTIGVIIFRPQELINWPQKLIIKPQELIVRPQGLINWPQELIIRPQELIIRGYYANNK